MCTLKYRFFYELSKKKKQYTKKPANSEIAVVALDRCGRGGGTINSLECSSAQFIKFNLARFEPHYWLIRFIFQTTYHLQCFYVTSVFTRRSNDYYFDPRVYRKRLVL